MDRASIVHELIKAYGLLDHIKVLPSEDASAADLQEFHSEDYISFLLKLNDMSEDEFYEERDLESYGLGYDCPYLSKVFDFASTIAGTTLTAVKALIGGSCRTAVNWFGGWHHAKKDQASGYCYVNDIVLGILTLLKVYQRVLYIDLDLHHGDGVEDAFFYTQRVLCMSVHKYEVGFFPGTGFLSDNGAGNGKYFTVNVPLREGIQDSDYCKLMMPLLTVVFDYYNPEVVVCQCGADTLSGDPMSGFNLTLKGPGECIKLLKSWNIPLLLLGGGGYNAENTARCWTYLTSLLVEKTLPEDIPTHENIMRYTPDFELHISPKNSSNFNNEEYMQLIRKTLYSNLENIRHIKK